MLKALQGESSFSPEILNQMLIEAEQKTNESKKMYEAETKNYADCAIEDLLLASGYSSKTLKEVAKSL